MQLTLVVPGLLDLSEPETSAMDGSAGAALARLLAAGAPPVEHDGALAIACASLGIARQRDWPIAPLLARAANVDPGHAYWLLAQPVRLLVGQQDVRLDAVVDDLSSREAAALVAAMNAHFAGDGLHFVCVGPARWLIAVPGAQELATHPVDAALGAPIGAFLPDGPDAARWRRWQTEMQMLLFAHSVTAQREKDGRAAPNGVWLSGGGTDAGSKPRIASLYSSAVLLRDLAHGCGIASEPAPLSFAAWCDAQPKSASLVWLPSLDAVAPSALEALGRDWADPLLAAFGARAIDELAVVVTGRGRALSFALRRRNLLARWRARLAPSRLSTLVAAAAR
jgi:hypothetical protein